MNRTCRRICSGLGLAGISLGLTGCVISIGSHRVPPPPFQPAPAAVVVTDAAEAATLAEINAAAQLNMESSRAQSLTQLASRPGLSVPLQVHLVNTTYRNMNMESSKVALLSVLIDRPDFGDATRQAIVSQLQSLNMDSSRQNILQQINRRLQAKPKP